MGEGTSSDGKHGSDGNCPRIESVNENSSSDDETRGSSFWNNNGSPSASAETTQKSSGPKASSRDGNRQNSFSFMGGDGDSPPSFSPNTASPGNAAASAVVSTEHERQILLLMLLAQVCALHDPTPRTFTVHVLELFERGILDRESIRFLFDYGLVPSLPPSTTSTSAPSTPSRVQNNNSTFEKSAAATENKAVIPYRADIAPSVHRSQEASAIRSHLEQHHKGTRSFPQQPNSPKPFNRTNPSPATSPDSSWAAKHFPLSLSRYQREFRQIKLLASGSFGQVFSATRHMDGRTYAVKKVIFSAQGYSNESVTQVVREVHCLAQCDHVHCVRYYTSWLEPSWMTGQGSSATIRQQEQQLLTDMERMVVDHDENIVVAPAASQRHVKRRFSFDSCLSEDDLFSIDDSDYSEWTQDLSSYNRRRRGDFSAWNARDDSMLGRRSRNAQKNQRPSPASQQQQQSTYKYQICLYIQMELCGSTTLADWIASRNAKNPPLAERVGPALRIFRQVCSGIAHIHGKGILHRDLKPANVFSGTSLDNGQEFFKIGDFGLSKLLRTANGEQDFVWETNKSTMEASKSAASAQSNALVARSKAGLPPPSLFCHEHDERDPWMLTAGVGTASYAAPEQLESRTYGPEADVFSMGLVLLELLCCFGTQHERFNTFHDCRKGELPSWVHKEYPHVASTILACCHESPASRPTAQDLLDSELFTQKQQSSTCKNGKEPVHDVVHGLKTRLQEKDVELQNQQSVIDEKDRIIEDLRRQVERLKTGRTEPVVTPLSPTTEVDPAAIVTYGYDSDGDDDDY